MHRVPQSTGAPNATVHRSIFFYISHLILALISFITKKRYHDTEVLPQAGTPETNRPLKNVLLAKICWVPPSHRKKCVARDANILPRTGREFRSAQTLNGRSRTGLDEITGIGITPRRFTYPGGLVGVHADQRVGPLELRQQNGREAEHSAGDELLERHDGGREELRGNKGITNKNQNKSKSATRQSAHRSVSRNVPMGRHEFLSEF